MAICFRIRKFNSQIHKKKFISVALNSKNKIEKKKKKITLPDFKTHQKH